MMDEFHGEDDDATTHQLLARPNKQTHLKVTVSDRASYDSGISLEDPTSTSVTPSPCSTIRRALKGSCATSHVRRMTQLFENLAHDELRLDHERHVSEAMSSTAVGKASRDLQQVTEESSGHPSPEVVTPVASPLLRAVPCQVLQSPDDGGGVESETRNAEIAHADAAAPAVLMATSALSETAGEDRIMARSVRASSVAVGRKMLSRRRTTQQQQLGVGASRALSYGDDKMEAEQHDYSHYHDDDEFDTEDESDGDERQEVVDTSTMALEEDTMDGPAAGSEGDFGEGGPPSEEPGPIPEALNIHVPAAEYDRGTPHYEENDDFSSSSFDSDSDEGEQRIDSSSSLKTKRVQSILHELLENEANYVLTLGRGIENYVSVMAAKDLPPGLRGQKYHIFGNIEKIHNLHEHQFLPKLRSNRASIAGIAETFISFLENDKFYCYIMFALNRPKSERICNRNLDFFQRRQAEVDDKLGLNSFLLQPIQRLPRYKLLLAEINKEILKQMEDTILESVKDEIGILCKAEKRLERFIDVVNEAMSINDIQECYEGPNCLQTELMNQCLAVNLFGHDLHASMVLMLRPYQDLNPAKRKPVNLFSQGKFRKMFEVDVYDWEHRRRYPAKLFLFERSAIYAEKVKNHLEYRGRYDDAEIGIHNENRNKVYLFARKRGLQEIEVTCGDMNEAQRLSRHVEFMMGEYAVNERDRINTLVRSRIPSVVKIGWGRTSSGIYPPSRVGSTHESSDSQTTWYVNL